MAIRDGLIGNPVLTGLLGRGGPVAIQQAANAQIARMQQRPQAARLRAPGAINLPPDNSVGQGLSQLGKALGDIADMKEQSAAKKDLADLYGQTTTVQEPATGQTTNIPRKVTSGDIYKLMGKYINNPTLQKSLGLQAQRLAIEEREERDRQFRRSERLSGQEYRTSERLGGQDFRTSERLGGQDFRTSERKDTQNFRTDERIAGQNFRTDERKASQGFRTDERKASQNFRTDERIASQEFQTGERKAKDKAAIELQKLKGQGVKGTLNQVHFSNGVVKAILRENNQDFIINDSGQRVSVEAALRDNKGAYIAKPEDYEPTSAEKKSESKVTAEVERGRNEFAEIETILTKIENNPELVGFRGDVVASAVTVSQILGNVFGDNGITRMGKMLAGDKKSQAFVDNINNMSEKLFESYIQLRTKAKGSRPIAEELKELKKLTNLREWTSSEKILANVENLRRRLKEDLEVIEKKKNIITGEGATTKSNSGTTRSGIKWTVK